MYDHGAGLAFTGGAGALALAGTLGWMWAAVACFTLLFAGFALLRLLPRREA